MSGKLRRPILYGSGVGAALGIVLMVVGHFNPFFRIPCLLAPSVVFLDLIDSRLHPWFLHGPGLALIMCGNLVFYTLLGATVGLLVPRRVDDEENFCAKCGYCLTGNVSGTCPECGRRLDVEPDKPASLSARAAASVMASSAVVREREHNLRQELVQEEERDDFEKTGDESSD